MLQHQSNASSAPAGVHHSKLPKIVCGCWRHVEQILQGRTRGQGGRFRPEGPRPLQDGQQGGVIVGGGCASQNTAVRGRGLPLGAVETLVKIAGPGLNFPEDQLNRVARGHLT